MARGLPRSRPQILDPPIEYPTPHCVVPYICGWVSGYFGSAHHAHLLQYRPTVLESTRYHQSSSSGTLWSCRSCSSSTPASSSISRTCHNRSHRFVHSPLHDSTCRSPICLIFRYRHHVSLSPHRVSQFPFFALHKWTCPLSSFCYSLSSFHIRLELYPIMGGLVKCLWVETRIYHLLNETCSYFV